MFKLRDGKSPGTSPYCFDHVIAMPYSDRLKSCITLEHRRRSRVRLIGLFTIDTLNVGNWPCWGLLPVFKHKIKTKP